MMVNDIPEDSLNDIQRRLRSQIEDMDEAELRVVAKSRESLAAYIAEAFYQLAKLIGYVIAVPIGWAVTIAESIWGGMQEGLTAGFKAGHPPKRGNP